jgi:hypothetical protein
LKIQGKLYNSTEKEPLMFANIYISDSQGVILDTQKGTTSDVNGAFALNNIDPLGFVTISAINIGKDIIKVSSLPSNGGVAVYNKKYSTQQQQIPTVVVRAPKKASANNPITNITKPVVQPTDSKKWLLPTIFGIGLLVIIGTGFAIKKWA